MTLLSELLSTPSAHRQWKGWIFFLSLLKPNQLHLDIYQRLQEVLALCPSPISAGGPHVLVKSHLFIFKKEEDGDNVEPRHLLSTPCTRPGNKWTNHTPVPQLLPTKNRQHFKYQSIDIPVNHSTYSDPALEKKLIRHNTKHWEPCSTKWSLKWYMQCFATYLLLLCLQQLGMPSH